MSARAVEWVYALPPGLVSPTQKAVLLAIAWRTQDGRDCTPTIEELARMTSYNSRSVTRALDSLPPALLTVERAQGRPNGYRINLDFRAQGGDSVSPLTACHPRHSVTPDRVSPLTECHPTPDRVSPPPLTECHPPLLIGEKEEQKGKEKLVATTSPKSAPDTTAAPPPGPPPQAELVQPETEFRFVLSSGTEWTLPAALLADLIAAHGATLSVEYELRKAAVWLKTNPGKRKTHAGMGRFLASWLSRAATDREGRGQAQNGKQRIIPARRNIANPPAPPGEIETEEGETWEEETARLLAEAQEDQRRAMEAQARRLGR